MNKIIFATTNKGKIIELKKILPEYEVLSMFDFDNLEDVEETGSTYNENALLKAQYLFDTLGIPVVSDDSGIEVHSLYGTKYGKDMAVPGVYSARYASDHNEDLNNEALLCELSDTPFIPDSNNISREARYVTVICYIDKEGETHFFEGEMKGIIANSPKGENGFAYDSIIYPFIGENLSTLTYAEMNDELKMSLSHRAKAVNKLKQYLNKL